MDVFVNYKQEILLKDSGGKNHIAIAKFDTGADNCSIDEALAKKLKLDGNIVGEAEIINANGSDDRPIIEIEIILKDREDISIKTYATLADRSNLDTPLLIGRNALQQEEGEEIRFFVDPNVEKVARQLKNIAEQIKKS